MINQAQVKELETLLAVDAEAVVAAQAAEFSRYAPNPLNVIILFGCAWLGKKTLANLRATNSVAAIYFCDNNPAVVGSDVHGIPVLSKADAVARFGDAALFVITIYNGAGVVEELRQLGCRHVVPYTMFYRAHHAQFMPLFALDTPEPIAQQAEAIRTIFPLLGDDMSREEVLRLLRWYLSPATVALARPLDPRDTYYPPDLMRPRADERFIDCGAYDGDSLRAFYDRWGGQFEKIAAFEPVADNLARIEQFRMSIPADFNARLEVYPYALGDHAGEVTFSVDEFSSSALGHDAARHAQQHQVKMVTLDAVMGDFRPTYLKMDIEGAEPMALRGAANILRQDVPLLAICLYHDIRHLWEIPLLIHALNPDYTLYLRRYSQDCWETVCYAIPPQRGM